MTSPAAGLGAALLARAARPLGLLDAGEIRSAMLSVARDAFVATDDQGVILAWEGGAESLLGWSRDEVVGLRFGEVCVPESHRPGHDAGLARIRGGAEMRLADKRIAMPVLLKDGRRRVVELSLGRVRVRGRLVLVASMRGI